MFGGIEGAQLRKHIIRPTLEALNTTIPYSRAAENLLLGTAAQESHMGRYLKQIHGPARGIYQMEPGTYDDIWRSFLSFQPEIGKVVYAFLLKRFNDVDQLAGNLYLATAMARIHYYRVSAALPKTNDVFNQAIYWKKYYNTPRGRGQVADFVDNYRRYVK